MAAIASSTTGPAQRAHDLLVALKAVVPSIASNITLSQQRGRGHESLACHDYDSQVEKRLNSISFDHEVRLLGLHDHRNPTRMRDIPDGPESNDSVREFLYPAGYEEGMTTALFTSSNRYVGLLNMSTDDASQPTNNARSLVGMLAKAIANAVDPALDIDLLLSGFDSLTDAALIDVDGVAHPVGDRPMGLLADHRVASAVSRRLTSGSGRWLLNTTDGTWLQLHAFRRTESQMQSILTVVEPRTDLLGLTRRELQVLSLIIFGCQNAEIARRLDIARRTVSTHVEAILHKLGLPNRSAAVAVALENGLSLLDLEELSAN